MKRSLSIYLLLAAFAATGSISAQESIKREVKLYNPFKPTLSWENKIHFPPNFNDTSNIMPEFRYEITPRVFMPEYAVATIGAARLEPDPLQKLYKGYLNLGFGNYFSPVGELSVSTERSRDKIAGLYAAHNSSFGKVELENEEVVNAGYMDNNLLLYGTRLFRRSALSVNAGLNHARRYAYGYNPSVLPLPVMDKDSLRTDYFNPSASVSYRGTRIDSSHLEFAATADYDLILQNGDYYQHAVKGELEFGYAFKPLYGKLNINYGLTLSSDALDIKPVHLVELNPSIGKRTESWAFKAGLKVITFSSDLLDEGAVPEYETKLFLHPDVRFQFVIIPSFASFFVALDGEMEENRALTVYRDNPFILQHDTTDGILPSAALYSLKPTDNKLRVSGGLYGSAGEGTSYSLIARYTLFEDMLLFTSDTVMGRAFMPVYDNGEMLNIQAAFGARINDKITIAGGGNYYRYQLETELKPWYKPDWDMHLGVEYNLRNKIIADATLYGVSRRFGSHGPMYYTSETGGMITELPLHISLNLGLEYRYTKILTFWTKLNNISNNRYFEYGFYPSQRFLFMAGFTYSM